jgi:hypothetical protein
MEKDYISNGCGKFFDMYLKQVYEIRTCKYVEIDVGLISFIFLRNFLKF